MDPSIARINGQFSFALQQFPTLCQESQYTFSIVFSAQPDKKFTISLPPTYPEIRPSISINNQQISTPLTDNWIPAFQLVHVVEHLNVMAQIPLPPKFNYRQDEIMAVVQSDLNKASNPDGRLELINQCQSVQAAKYAAEEARIKAKQSTEASEMVMASAVENSSDITTGLMEKNVLEDELRTAEASQPMIMIQARKAKIAQLREEAQRGNYELQQLRSTFNAANPVDYLKQFEQLKQKQRYALIVADALESLP